jgi:4-hydroxythreonine-4-phosphate dehydrogenase
MGDPCGVGPEIIVKLFCVQENLADHDLLVLGDPPALERAVDHMGMKLRIQRLADPEEYRRGFQTPGSIPVFTPAPLALEDLRYGAPSEASCLATIRYIEVAVQLALAGRADAVCTCPIHKGNLHRHGFAFPGHTEFLSDLTASRRVVMMLAGPRLRVALLTIHEPLHCVPGLITEENLREALLITGTSLVRDFGIPSPRIAVAALNPHAGEGGRFGREEMDVITPVIQNLKVRSCSVTGPYPADTLFFRAFQGEFDAVVAMYHDQGLIPVKLVHFHDAVNVTLGLPIIRTSVDHGTAYELAGTGLAHPGSLEAAVRLAGRMARHRSGAESVTSP